MLFAFLYICSPVGFFQVEQVRLNIPWDQPLAVQQWEGLIAVNYAARAAGVVRHDRVSEALHKVPSA